MSIRRISLAALGAVILAGAGNLSCSALECGTGTVARDGVCVPADEQPDNAQCGEGTELGQGGLCVPSEVVVCDPDTTLADEDPVTGVITCIGISNGGCSVDTLPGGCPDPSSGKVTLCGRLYDSQTDAVFQAAAADGTPCDPNNPTSEGPCSMSLTFYDAVDFAQNPATAQPLVPADLYYDDCGRYRATDLPRATFGFIGLGIDDATGAADRNRLTGVATPNAPPTPTAHKKFKGYVTRNETDMAWTQTAGLTGMTFAERGVLAIIFHYHDLPVAGVQVRRNMSPIPNDDYYFSDTDPARSTVAVAQTTTGANGTVLVTGAPSPTNHDGVGSEPSGCQWPNNLAASIPTVVFMQIKDAETAGGAECP